MPSLLWDAVFCLALVAGAYLVFRNRAGQATASGSSSKRKNKKSKSKKKANGPDEAVAIEPARAGPKQEQGSSSGGIQAAAKSTTPAASKRQPTTEKKPTVNDRRDSSTVLRAGGAPKTSERAEDFPPLSYAAASSSQPRPLAERLAKKPRRTGVEDMIDKEVEQPKAFARTMRIVKPQPEPVTLLDEANEDDSDDDEEASTRHSTRNDTMRRAVDAALRADEDDGAWKSVPVSSKKPAVLRVNASASNSSGANTPPRTVPGMGEPTKKQRQNAARAAAAREAKEAAERERLATLAAHKKQLERERMTQQAKEKSRNGSNGTRTNRQTLSGGMQAKVSETGALIWD